MINNLKASKQTCNEKGCFCLKFYRDSNIEKGTTMNMFRASFHLLCKHLKLYNLKSEKEFFLSSFNLRLCDAIFCGFLSSEMKFQLYVFLLHLSSQ